MKTWEAVHAEDPRRVPGFPFEFRSYEDFTGCFPEQPPAAGRVAQPPAGHHVTIVARRDAVVRCVDFSCDGRYLAAGTKDGHLIVHETAKVGENAKPTESERDPRDRDGGEVDVRDRDVRDRRDAPGPQLAQYVQRARARPLLEELTGGNAETGRRGEVNSLRWHPTNPAIVATTCGDVVKIWNVTNKAAEACVKQGDLKNVENAGHGYNMRWHPNGKYLYISTTGNFLVVYYAGSLSYDASHKLERAAVNKFTEDVETNDFDLYAGGSKLLACEENGNLDAFTITKTKGKRGGVEEHKLRRTDTLRCYESAVYSLGVDPKGRYFAVGGEDSVVTCLALNTCEAIGCFGRCTDEIRSIAYSHDGELLCVMSKKELFILHAGTLKVLMKFPDLSEDASYYHARWHPKKYCLLYCTEGAREYREDERLSDLGCVYMWRPTKAELSDA